MASGFDILNPNSTPEVSIKAFMYVEQKISWKGSDVELLDDTWSSMGTVLT
jgi:hypothetical protein